MTHNKTMEITNTKDRSKVQAIWKWSMQLVNQGKAEEIKNWEKKCPWHNSKFREIATKKQWVVYLPDQAWSGEVKLITTELSST